MCMVMSFNLKTVPAIIMFIFISHDRISFKSSRIYLLLHTDTAAIFCVVILKSVVRTAKRQTEQLSRFFPLFHFLSTYFFFRDHMVCVDKILV